MLLPPPRRGLAIALAISLALHGLTVFLPASLSRWREAPPPLKVLLAAPSAASAPAGAMVAATSDGESAAPPAPVERSYPVASGAPPGDPEPAPARAADGAPAVVEPGPRGAAPGAATAAGVDRDAALLAYRDLLARQIRPGEQDFPRLARNRNWEGTTLIRLRIVDGRADAPQVARGSGYPLLDEAALRIVAASPLPPWPAALAGHTLSVEIPINFNFRDRAGP